LPQANPRATGGNPFERPFAGDRDCRLGATTGHSALNKPIGFGSGKRSSGHAAHKHPKVRQWLDRHPRWTFHFTPT
jgi:hypothetical protein